MDERQEVAIKKPEHGYLAFQYAGGLLGEQFEQYLSAAQKVRNTVDLNHVWKLEIECDPNIGVQKVSVNDWILRDETNTYSTITDADFLNHYEIVPK